MVILKIVFLFLAVWMTSVNLARLAYKNDIRGGHLFLMAIGIVGFIVLQFNLL